MLAVLCTHIMIGSHHVDLQFQGIGHFRSSEALSHVHDAHTYNEGKSFMYIKY